VTFESEESLCRAFVAAARAEGWTAYPEQGGWDVLLLRHRVQVGVQAKLRGGVDVLLQALPPLTSLPVRRRGRLSRAGDAGPRYRAVLVGGFAGRTPAARGGRRAALYALAAYVGIVVLEPPETGADGRWLRVGWRENLPREFRRYPHRARLDVRAYRWRPAAPVWTPPFVPDHPAGVPAPRTVGPWQLAAVRLELRAEAAGFAHLDLAREVTAEVGGAWDPRTLLKRYFVCAGGRVPGTRQARWEPRRRTRASLEFPEVAARLRSSGLGDEGGSK
jgi:hypothetical protein